VALAFAGPAVLLGGGVAWAADPTPTPDPALDPGVESSAPEAPVVEPSIGTWIIGGTLLEGSAAKPVAKPAAKPVAKPAAATSARSAVRSTARSTARPSAGIGTAISTAPDGATALPFTGGHVEALLPAGITLLVGGIALTLVGRPRRVAA
jgi:hypothetical protein